MPQLLFPNAPWAKALEVGLLVYIGINYGNAIGGALQIGPLASLSTGTLSAIALGGGYWAYNEYLVPKL
jgi:hypothetical protein